MCGKSELSVGSISHTWKRSRVLCQPAVSATLAVGWNSTLFTVACALFDLLMSFIFFISSCDGGRRCVERDSNGPVCLVVYRPVCVCVCVHESLPDRFFAIVHLPQHHYYHYCHYFSSLSLSFSPFLPTLDHHPAAETLEKR